MNQTFAWEMVGNHHQFHPFKFLVVWSSRLVCFASESFLQPRLQDMVLALCSNVGNWDALGALSQGGCLKHMLGGQWNRSFSVGGLWNLSCSRARYRESLVNRMVVSEPCIVCLAATTLSAKINSWPRLILWNHLLLVQWSEFRKSDLPNKYKIPARSIRKICCKMNLIFPSWSGLQHYAMAIFAWPLFLNMALFFEKRSRAMFEFKKRLTDPCKVVNCSPRCTLAIYYHRILSERSTLKTFLGKSSTPESEELEVKDTIYREERCMLFAILDETSLERLRLQLGSWNMTPTPKLHAFWKGKFLLKSS